MNEQLIAETMGERILRLRNKHGYSQNKIEHEIGLGSGYLTKVELNKIKPSPKVLAKLAQFFKVPMKELLQDEEHGLEIATRIKMVEVLLEIGQSSEAEELISELQEHPELSDADKIKLSVHLAECRYKQGKYHESLEILLPLIEGLEQENYHDAWALAWIRNLMGSVYFVIEDHTNAIYNYKKAKDYTQRIALFDLLSAKISYNLGLCLRIIGKNRESLEHLQSSFDYFFKIGKDPAAIAQTYFQQGVSYKNLKNFERAIECLNNAKAIFQELNLEKWYNEVQLLVASVITVEQDPSLAINQLIECAELFEKARDSSGVLVVYTRMITVYLLLKDTQSILVIAEKALGLLERFDLLGTPQCAEFYRGLAQFYYSEDNFERSLQYALQSQVIFAKMGLIQDQIDSLRFVVDSYQGLGDLNAALRYANTRCDLYATLNERRS